MAKTAAPSKKTKDEQFIAAYNEIMNLPAGTEGAYKGKNPDGPASVFQKRVLTDMGIAYDEKKTTSLQAHCSMGAFKMVEPEKADEIWAKINAEKAAGKGEKREGFIVSADKVDSPCTYSQLVIVDKAGIRPLSSKDPIPTQGQVAESMNALYKTDKAKYDQALENAKATTDQWKHSKPTDNQKILAEAAGIKVTPFVPARGIYKQNGSTSFSVGQALHDLKANEPEAYAAAKEAVAAKQAEAVAANKPSRAVEKVTGAMKAQAAIDAARDSTTITFQIPDTAPEAQSSELGE